MTHSQRVNAHFGLDVPFCLNANFHNRAFDILDDSDSGWNYNRPSGGANAPYRQSDYGKVPSDSSDPQASGGGYNDNAQLPMQVLLDQTGITEVGDGTFSVGYVTDSYYEINKQVTQTFHFLFKNSNFKDLNITDFFSVGTWDSNRQWRPVFQIWSAAQWGGDEPTPIYEGGGSAFTQWYQESATLDVDLTQYNFSENQLYYMVVGIGCCDPTAHYWHSFDGSDDDCLFLPPFDYGQKNNIFSNPYFFPFKITNHEERKISVVSMQYYDSGRVRWVDATGTAPYFTIGVNATKIGITMEIDKKNVPTAYFVAKNSSSPTPTFKIKAEESWYGSSGTVTTDIWLQPSLSPSHTTNPWGDTSYETIPKGSSGTVTVYATLFVNVRRGETRHYHMYSSQNGATYAHNGYFSITMPA